MRIGNSNALPRKRSQVYPGKNLAYLNGVSLRGEQLQGLSAVDPGAIVWIQNYINQHSSQFHAVANNNYSPGTIMPVGPQNTQIGRFVVNGVTYYYSPAQWAAGGGGLAKLPPDKAAALGGLPVTVPAMTAAKSYGQGASQAESGYVFDHNPGGALAPGAANPTVAYTPGTGGDFVKTVAPLAIIAALPFAAAAITAAAAGGAAAGGAASAGAIMPGAEAAASGATGGILTSGSAAGSALIAPAAETAAAGAVMPGAAAAASGATGGIVSAGGAAGAAGAGLTTTGVVGAVKTAAGLVQQAASAGGVVAKVANLVTQHSDAANALATTAQQQADAGNIAAANALQNQADQNALMAQAYQQQLQSGVLGTSIGGMPLWAILAGGAVLLVAVTVSLSKRK
jgi:hypothetical protein